MADSEEEQLLAAAAEFSQNGGLPGWVVYDMIALANRRPTSIAYTDDQEYILYQVIDDLYPDEILKAAQEGFGIGLKVNWDAKPPI